MNAETELFSEHEAAQQLGLSVATLRRRRLFRQPPVWVKLGARVLYWRYTQRASGLGSPLSFSDAQGTAFKTPYRLSLGCIPRFFRNKFGRDEGEREWGRSVYFRDGTYINAD